jgi:hypothetical protein
MLPISAALLGHLATPLSAPLAPKTDVSVIVWKP